MKHFIKKCTECGGIISQCRCPDKNKAFEYGVCENCKPAKQKTDSNYELIEEDFF